jgi:hypothetical protein
MLVGSRCSIADTMVRSHLGWWFVLKRRIELTILWGQFKELLEFGSKVRKMGLIRDLISPNDAQVSVATGLSKTLPRGARKYRHRPDSMDARDK